MALPVLGIIGGLATAGTTAYQIVNSNKQADRAEAQAKANNDEQTKLYNQQAQQVKDQEGAGAATTVRNQASQFESDNIKQASGAQSTILTSPLGIPDSDDNSTQKKTLLGM